jgi:signal transduction histidine kinase
VVYRSPWQYAGYAASYPLSKYVSGFSVQATLRGDVARRIVGDGSGGRGRLAVLLALLALTALLLAVALRQLRREAALARMRADFVSSVSHELRTPLTQIRMFAELLRLGWTRSAEERERSLAVIDQEAHRLGLLVERVLAFDRTERLLALDGTGRTAPSLTTEESELAPLVHDAVTAFRPLAAVRGVTIETRLGRAIVAPVDRGALRQILVNQLDNAVKYGPDGQTIAVSLRVHGAYARLVVDDGGPGIPPADRDAVWEPFHRLARDANSSVAGSGIGLAVVRRLALAHGGRAIVESAPAGGARIVVDLPRVVGAPTTSAEAPTAGEAPERV